MSEQRGYHIVVNAEEQHSLWPVDRDLPDGWRAQGFRGSRDECLAEIDRIWPDITPKSARRG